VAGVKYKKQYLWDGEEWIDVSLNPKLEKLLKESVRVR